MLSQDPGSETQFILVIFLVAVSLFGLMLIGVLIAGLPQIRGRAKPEKSSSSELPAPALEEAPSDIESSPETGSAPLNERTETARGPARELLEETASRAVAALETEVSPGSSLDVPTDSVQEHEQELIEEPASAAETAPEREAAPRPAFADHTQTTTEQAREPIDAEAWSTRQILGVALTGALMMAIPLAAVRFASDVNFVAALLPISTAAAGAIGFRAGKLSWRQTVLAAVLAGAVFPLMAGFIGMHMQNVSLFAGVIWGSGGVFLLPLFNPAVRQAGPSLSPRKVAARALALTMCSLVLLIPAVLWILPGPDFGSSPFANAFVYVLIVGLIVLPSSVLLAGGLIVALFAPRSAVGSWLGGVGILYSYFMPVGIIVLVIVRAL